MKEDAFSRASTPWETAHQRRAHGDDPAVYLRRSLRRRAALAEFWAWYPLLCALTFAVGMLVGGHYAR